MNNPVVFRYSRKKWLQMIPVALCLIAIGFGATRAINPEHSQYHLYYFIVAAAAIAVGIQQIYRAIALRIIVGEDAIEYHSFATIIIGYARIKSVYIDAKRLVVISANKRINIQTDIDNVAELFELLTTRLAGRGDVDIVDDRPGPSAVQAFREKRKKRLG